MKKMWLFGGVVVMFISGSVQANVRLYCEYDPSLKIKDVEKILVEVREEKDETLYAKAFIHLAVAGRIPAKILEYSGKGIVEVVSDRDSGKAASKAILLGPVKVGFSGDDLTGRASVSWSEIPSHQASCTQVQ